MLGHMTNVLANQAHVDRVVELRWDGAQLVVILTGRATHVSQIT